MQSASGSRSSASTPLTSITGYLRLVLGDQDALSAEQFQFLDVVNRNAERLHRLVDDLLFLARMDAGQLTLELGDTDLVDVASLSIEAMRPRADARGVALTLDTPGAARLRVDPERLGQLLDNLVSNAVKFTPEGGTVGVQVSPIPDSLRLTVSDSGIGIPAGEQEQLFQRFFRASTATSRQIQGTGLGLTISRAIVESHGGRDLVRKRGGQGHHLHGGAAAHGRRRRLRRPGRERR